MARLILVAHLLLLPMMAIAQPHPRYEGMPLAEALRLLQKEGLQIVFSSETVTTTMRVLSEPRGRSRKDRLDDLLAPHGLKAIKGPAGTLLIVRAPQRMRPLRQNGAPVAPAVRPETIYREEVRVQGSYEPRAEPGVASEVTLRRNELLGLRSVTTDDPLQSIHSLPHVAGGDDFRSEFSVRGSPYRHVGVVIDGVSTSRLLHTAYGRGYTGSLSMLHSDLLECATLDSGAYPQRFAPTIGGQLSVTIREGSREANAFHVALNGSSGAAIAEGPIGSLGRGSWLASARNSYRTWPTRGFRPFNGTMFGFSDALAKLVYDVRPHHQVSLSMLGGYSSIDELDGEPYQPGDGRNRTGVMNLGLRSAFGSRFVVNQRASFVAHEFLNKTESGFAYSGGYDQELSYRADLSRELRGGLLESGAEIHNFRSSDISEWVSAAYAHYRWHPTGRLTIAPGVRAAYSTRSGERPLGRWVLSELALTPKWTAFASAGVAYQFPSIEFAGISSSTAPLKPEQATYLDLGLRRRVASAFSWQATVYRRHDRNLLREPRAPGERWENTFTGSSHGVELLLERQQPTGLSGWVAYSFGETRYTDTNRNESFWADFDQRHALNLHAAFRPSTRSSLAMTFRGGTNFPIPGYFEARRDGLFAGGRRNDVRLRPYARLDVRADRSFVVGGHRTTLYVEMLNVLDRTNFGLANGTVRSTGEAVGFTTRLIPRLPSAGVVIEF